MEAAQQDDLHLTLAALRSENERLRLENEQYRKQFTELEARHTDLANLYVASYQLHGTLDREGVVAAIQEIVINLIGSESFGVFECTADAMQPICAVGLSPEETFRVERLGHQLWGELQRGELLLRPAAVGEWLAWLPLKINGRVTGVIAIRQLLPHKEGLEPVDFELFDLLANQAATSLLCTSLLAQAQVPA